MFKVKSTCDWHEIDWFGGLSIGLTHWDNEYSTNLSSQKLAEKGCCLFLGEGAILLSRTKNEERELENVLEIFLEQIGDN